MKKLLALSLALLLVLSLAACGNNNDPDPGDDPADDPSIGDTLNPEDENGDEPGDEPGDETGDENNADPASNDEVNEIGKTFNTAWFSFSVDAIYPATEYAGYNPAEGYVFLVTTVTETNNWYYKDTLPMGDSDFYIELNGDPDDLLSCEDPWDDTMMPNAFDLAPDETVTYNMVFHIPEDTQSIKFIYTEIADDDSVGKTYSVNYTL